MKKADRQRRLLEIISARRYEKISRLAEELNVSHDTISRDLNELTESASFYIFKATLCAISKSGYCAHSAHNAEHKFAGFHNKTDASAKKAKIPLFILEKMCYNSIAKFF